MKKFISYILIVASILLIIPIGVSFFKNDFLGTNLILLCHILSSASITIAFYILTAIKPNGEQRYNVWWIYAFVSSFFIPFYGLLCFLCIYLVQKLKLRNPPPIISDEITIQDPEVFSKKTSKTMQLEILSRLDIEPFADIFRRGQSDLKKSAVKLLGTMRSKKAVKTLRVALLDRDIEIRLIAAGVLGKIEDEYTTDIKTRQTKFDKSKSKKRALELVDYYIKYAESGLLDTIARNYYFNETLKVLNSLPEDSQINYLKAKSYYEIKDYENAEYTINFCIQKEPKNEAYNELYWNILFNKRDYEKLSNSIKKSENKKTSKPEQEILNFWTN